MIADLKKDLLALLNDELDDAADTKTAVRSRYAPRRRKYIEDSSRFLRQHIGELRRHFASGSEIDPSNISPRLEVVESDRLTGRLFRLATFFWSVPPSQGFGRRSRFLVWDDGSSKLIGIIGLTDPVFNLAARDKWIGWNATDRKARLRLVADAYTLGAVPPYSMLLGGKLVASLLSTNEILLYLNYKYANSTSIILGKPFSAPVLFTTSSALGRSSIYNRLTLRNERLFEHIGWTSGFGHFQVPNDMFLRLRSLLRAQNHPYADGHSYGTGPNWRMRVIRAAVGTLGLNEDQLLNHGVKREVFGVSLATNFREILRGVDAAPVWKTESIAIRAAGALERWVLPRAERDPSYLSWNADAFFDDLLLATEEKS